MASGHPSPLFAQERLDRLVRWSRLILIALLVTIFGTLGAAWIKTQSDDDPETCAVGDECKKSRGPHGPPPPPVHPIPPPASLTLDFDVNVGAPSSEPASAEGDRGAATQTVTINGVPVSAKPPATQGAQNVSGEGGATQTVTIEGMPLSAQVSPRSGGTDLVLVLDREKVVEKTPPEVSGPKPCETLCSSCEDDGESVVTPDPCATARLIARVRFEPGKRRIISWHEAQNGEIRSIGQIAQDLEKSAEAEQRRFPKPTAALLVVGHTDPGHTGSCLRSSLGKRRAKKVRRALRRLNERLGEIRIYAQAAGDDPMAPEGSCEARYYGTVGVYLIEGMR